MNLSRQPTSPRPLEGDPVRQAMLLGVRAALPDLIAIATGELTVTCHTKDGVPYERAPTHTERIRAFAELARHALPSRAEVTGKDGDPLRVAVGPDLSTLSDVRLRQLAAWLDEGG